MWQGSQRARAKRRRCEKYCPEKFPGPTQSRPHDPAQCFAPKCKPCPDRASGSAKSPRPKTIQNRECQTYLADSTPDFEKRWARRRGPLFTFLIKRVVNDKFA